MSPRARPRKKLFDAIIICENHVQGRGECVSSAPPLPAFGGAFWPKASHTGSPC